ncbi:ribosome silencing factor [Phorcysia thermohydrogeniphila]|uniref:Ribosomal silencing factor RsfS n=1 Tax=Phorcysia thermohydrogeniphila TaxID=936138 RepID=A0A4R1GK71_9BACT|nr:ribosome silencing factor [Phorcysia thermohydrogeniphila]TCK04682.1 ribosome-associated protein [Phorcysia thermohydrogeniphila]
MDTLRKLKTALKAALDKKAENPVVIDLRELTTLADYFVVLSASSDTHARTIADEIKKKLKETGILPLSMEGYETANWILLDYGDVIIHIFRPEFRELYNLESLWMDAPRVEVSELVSEEAEV